jgi:predicted enzyme related to lactoylglutathione lyase
MGRPVVHFEITGSDPGRLRRYYSDLFGWEHNVGDAATPAVSQDGEYGFIDAATNGGGINGGVGGGAGYESRVLFYVSVGDVEKTLTRAEELGGERVMGPEGQPGKLVVGFFTDPEDHLIGVAGIG